MEMYSILASLRKTAEEILKQAPDEGECTKAENEVYADLANLVNSIGNLGIAAEKTMGDENQTGDPEWHVAHWISGVYEFSVRAKDRDTALQKAEIKVQETDFGPLQNIEWDSLDPLGIEKEGE